MGSSLWGCLKSKVYVRKPRTVDDLKVSIREEIATVPKEMLVNVMQNFEERLRTCLRQDGRHLSYIIFRNWVINVSNQNCIYYRLFWFRHNFFILKINKVTVIWNTYVIFAPPFIRRPEFEMTAMFRATCPVLCFQGTRDRRQSDAVRK